MQDTTLELLESLTHEQEGLLKMIHGHYYTGLDDDMSEAYEEWLE